MGKTQDELMPLYEGLKREIAQLPRALFDKDPDVESYRRMDAWPAEREKTINQKENEYESNSCKR